jgi:hypothetical protein
LCSIDLSATFAEPATTAVTPAQRTDRHTAAPGNREIDAIFQLTFPGLPRQMCHEHEP